jgi:hypothetical protein
MAKTLAQKLFIKPGYTIRLLNAPEGFDLGEVPDAVTVDSSNEKHDAVILFVKSHADLAEYFAKAHDLVKYDALLWIAYPKQSSKTKADINRDTMYKAVLEWNYEGVTQVAIDDTWSALRFRPKEKVGK